MLAVDSVHASSQAEVANLDRAVVVNQDVARLQVAVNDLCFVQVVQAAQDVVNNRLHLRLFEVLARLDQLFEVHVALAQNKVHFIELQVLNRRLSVSKHVAWRDHAEQAVAARMRHFLQDVHLAEQAAGSLSVAKHMLVALAGVLSLGRQVYDLHDAAVRPLAQLLDELELGWQHKVLIQVVKAQTELIAPR